MMTHGLTNFKL